MYHPSKWSSRSAVNMAEFIEYFFVITSSLDILYYSICNNPVITMSAWFIELFVYTNIQYSVTGCFNSNMKMESRTSTFVWQINSSNTFGKPVLFPSDIRGSINHVSDVDLEFVIVGVNRWSFSLLPVWIVLNLLYCYKVLFSYSPMHSWYMFFE